MGGSIGEPEEAWGRWRKYGGLGGSMGELEEVWEANSEGCTWFLVPISSLFPSFSEG